MKKYIVFSLLAVAILFAACQNAPKKAEKTEPAPSPEALYNQAQNLFMAGKLAESIDKFADFILGDFYS